MLGGGSKQLVVGAMFSTEELAGTTVKKEGVPFQFSISLPPELLLLFCANFLMEEIALP